jgi:hypothetical protein
MTDTTTSPPPADPYAAPTLDCDIVMKGGITSGVVYPLAIAELARDYRFRSIGGTSAGAIAAAAAGAAEYSRHRRTGGTGFPELERLPAWLSGPSKDVVGSNLFALFQPQRGALPIYSVITAGLRKKGRIGRILRAALTEFAGGALAGAAPGIAIGLLAALFARDAGLVLSLFAAAIIAVVGAGVGMALSAGVSASRGLVGNRYGMCSGAPGAGYGDAPALTPWLTELLDRMAGIPDTRRGQSIPRGGEPPEPLRKPLTFGDLWGTDDPKAEHDVELQFVTTNATHGRPHRLPYDTTGLYFDPAELRDYFPDWVVEWMEKRPRAPRRPRKEGDERSFTPDPRLRILPEPADLPVIFGARLSLSFPFLISAIPLYAVDFTRPLEARRQERCWFSDGGLCSNFPVHFFDRPLPAWPTFAINLRDLPPAARLDPVEANNSYVVPRNGGGLGEWWTRFDRGGALKQLGGFAAALGFAAKDWHDHVQLKVPGYRDRVVHVSLSPDEGGLNLDMPAELIEHLGARGRAAGKKLGDRFSPSGDGTEMTWDNHRWIRFRSTLNLLEEELRSLRTVLDATRPAGASYRDLIAREDPPSYGWASAAQRTATLEWADRLLNDDFLKADKPVTERGTPRPRPELRIVPRI